MASDRVGSEDVGRVGSQRSPDSVAGPKAMLPWAVFSLALAGGLARAVTLLRDSPGAAMDDEIGHFLISRDVWNSPELVLSLWGRTLNTLIYATSAPFGLEGARGLSLLLVAAACILAWRLARQLGIRHAWLVPLFLWFQPWVLEYSFTCLTEIPFLLFLVAGLYAFARDRSWLAGLLIGSLPLIRHEGLGLVAAWLAYATVSRNWRLFAGLALPYASFCAAYAVILDRLPFHILSPEAHTDHYGRGSWFHFFPPLAASAGIPLLVALLGLPRLVRTNTAFVITGTYILYLSIHVVVFRMGLFASGGYVVFLLPLAPFIAVAAATGVDLVEEELRNTRLRISPWGSAVPPALVSGVGIAALLVATIGSGLRLSQPFGTKPVQEAMIETVAWLHQGGLDQRPIEAASVWFYYEMPRTMPEPTNLAVHYTPLEQLDAGTLVVWDNRYSDGWGRPLKALSEARTWRRLEAFGPGPEVIVFEKIDGRERLD